MVKLSEVSGLEIVVDLSIEKLKLGGTVHCTNYIVSTLNEMSGSLLNQNLTYPQIVGHQHNGVMHLDDLSVFPKNYRYDVLMLPAGRLGIEFIKSHIYFSPNGVVKAASIVQVYYGELTVLMQKTVKTQINKYVVDEKVVDIKLARVRVGEKLVVPAGYSYSFINETDDPVVFSRVLAGSHVVDKKIETFKKGLSMYVISKNGKSEYVRNPKYTFDDSLSDSIIEYSVDEMNDNVDFNANQVPLYVEVKEEVAKFMALLHPVK